MSALSMIRNNIGLVAVIIGISLLGFILTDLLSSANRSGGAFQGSSEAGMVAGQKVSRDRYAERVDQYVQSRQNQFGSLTPTQRYQAEDDAWNSLVSEIVFEQELEDVGVSISGAEVLDMFVGEKISPLVIQQFAASADQYDVNQVKTFLQQVQDDPDPESASRQQMKAFEDYLVQVRSIEQYQNAFKSGYVGSTQMAAQQHEEQTKAVDLTFLGVNYSQIADSTVNVSDNDLRSYISSHAKEFDQEEETFVSFVRYDINPSKADSVIAYAKLAKQKQAFSETTLADSTYTASRTRFPFSPGISQPISDVPAGIKDLLVDANEKDVFGPILEGRYYRLYKVVEVQDTADYFANINHILVRFAGSTAADTAKALTDARAIRRDVTAGNFGEVAAEKSQDFASRANGGEIGWYRKFTSYGEDFDKAVGRASVGSVIGPIKSNQGYHIVQVVNKTRKTFSIANIEQIIYPSDNTRDSVYNDVNRLAQKATASGDLDASAAELGLTAIKSNGLARSTKQVQGLPVGRQLVRWAIDASTGDLSTIIEINNDIDKTFVFGQVTDRVAKGLQQISNPGVRSRAFAEVVKEKKAAMIMAKLSGGSDLNSIKDGYGAGAFVSSAKGINFSSSSIPGIGNDLLIVGTALGMETGQQSAPIAGENGVFILKVDDVRGADPLDAATLATRKVTDVLTTQRNYISKVEPALMELGDAEDTREQAGY